jgi:monomeric sarcosine oxidase
MITAARGRSVIGGKLGLGLMEQSPEIVVVGAGAFGGWTALYLRELGHSVFLIDAYGPGNSRSSSGGETRQIRAGYGDRVLYTQWAKEASRRWRARQEAWNTSLFLQTGRLVLSPEWTKWLADTKAVLDQEQIPGEVLQQDDLARRYPQINVDGIGCALLEPTAGVLKARQACQAVADAFVRTGGRLRVAHAALGRRSGRRLLDLRLSTGEPVAAQSFVFACGPWLAKVFREVLHDKLFVPRRDVFFFGTPPGDERFSYPNLPNFCEEESAGFYGFPSLDGRGFKICPTGEQTIFDPDRDDRVVTPERIARARDYLARRFPAMADQPLVETRVCQLEMSIDEHFIIDRHPQLENVWIAGGGSGHGFKHGPVVGEYLANRITGRVCPADLAALFKLKAGTFSFGGE